MLKNKGQSLIIWTVTFGVVTATLFFVSSYLKRGLQDKVRATADYSFWTAWGNNTSQYKGEVSTYVKTQASQKQKAGLRESKNATLETYVDSQGREETASSSVEQGSEPLLKTLDLNQIVN